MSLQTPAGLEQSVDNLRGMMASLIGEIESLKNRVTMLEAKLSGHQHTLSITATTTGTDSLGGNITATTTASGTAGTPW